MSTNKVVVVLVVVDITITKTDRDVPLHIRVFTANNIMAQLTDSQ